MSVVWGLSPTTTANIQGSPAPTSTTFTLDSAIDFLPGQWIIVTESLGANPQRVKILSIAGNDITLDPSTPLSSPLTTEFAISYRELLTNTKLNQGSLWQVNDLAGLKAVQTVTLSLLSQNGLQFNAGAAGLFTFSSTTVTGNDITRVNPTVGPGTFTLMPFCVQLVKVADLAALKAIDTTNFLYDDTPFYVKNFNGRPAIFRWSSASSATPDDVRVVQPTTGSGRFLRDFPYSDGPDEWVLITKTSHGYSVLDQIKPAGSSTTSARGNTIANATNVWTVAQVLDANNVIAVRSGRVRVASHGLTIGSTYYLSASSAKAITTTKPVGSTSVPLGFFLPVIYVEDANTIVVLGQGRPTNNPLLAEFVVGRSNVNAVSFTNLDANAVGSVLRFELTATLDDLATDSVQLRINNLSDANYWYINRYDDKSAAGVRRQTSSPTNQFELTYAINPATDPFPVFASGSLRLEKDSVNGGSVALMSEYLTNPSTNYYVGDVKGAYSGGVNNITRLEFCNFGSPGTDILWSANTGQYVKIYKTEAL